MVKGLLFKWEDSPALSKYMSQFPSRLVCLSCFPHGFRKPLTQNQTITADSVSGL